MRRTPEPIEDSPSTAMRPMWPVLGTWVPAHSSLDQSPPDGDDANLLAVLLPEQGHGACSPGGVDVHDLIGDGQVLGELGVDALLDAGDLLASQG